MKKETIKKRRAQIFDAAVSLVLQKGFEETTLDDIAGKLKLSKPALYLYFKNKESLFCALLEDKFKSFQEKIDSVIKNREPGLVKLKKLITFHIDDFSGHLNFFHALQGLLVKMNLHERSKMSCSIMAFHKRYVSSVSGLIKQCITEKSLRPGDESFLAYSLIGLIRLNLLDHFFITGKRSPAGLDERIFDLFLKGAGL